MNVGELNEVSEAHMSKSHTPGSGLGRRLSRFRTALLGGAPLILLAAWFGGGRTVHAVLNSEKPTVEVAVVHDGRTLYVNNCAGCHGERGDGRGVTLLEPRARYFGMDKYKFATTLPSDKGIPIPSDADIVHVLKHGLPGSAMPSFANLNDGEHLAIVDHVRQLTRGGLFERFKAKAWKDASEEAGEPLKQEEFAKEFVKLYSTTSMTADLESLPGKSLGIPDHFPLVTPESTSRGREAYMKVCAACHGLTGQGDGPQVKDLKNEDGTPNRPRNLTRGVFKAGGDSRNLYARIMLGIPGTPMPASAATLKANEVLDLIHYVQSLSGTKPTNEVAASVARVMP